MFANTEQRAQIKRLLLTGLLCLEKLQRIKFDLYRQRYMPAESTKANVFSLGSFPKVDLSSVFIRVNGETNAAFMSE